MNSKQTASTRASANGAETADVELTLVRTPAQMPASVSLDALAEFLHVYMQPYNDALPDVKRGIEDALSINPGTGGYLACATENGRLVGAIVMRGTGMRGYIPETVLLFVCVHPDMRGKGIGEKLIRLALDTAEGAEVKLHVEYDNPAKRLYERIGFASKYAEMRYRK